LRPFLLDIVEALEKNQKTTSTSKEFREKSIEGIFHLFVTKLSSSLTNAELASASDLILNKPLLVVEQTHRWDWPLIEVLKVQNVDPMAILVYNYLRHKFLLKNTHSNESLHKAFDNLTNLLLNFLGKRSVLPFSDEVLWTFVNDYTELYIKSIENLKDSTEEIEEKAEGLGAEVDEETSKQNL
jgi:hypothetical protein